MLSPFGDLFEHYRQRSGLSKRKLAAAAGITSSSVMTDVLRERGQGIRAYGPPLHALAIWAKTLELDPMETEWFCLLGRLEHGDQIARDQVIQLYEELRAHKDAAMHTQRHVAEPTKYQP